jgi:hypothetical protein
MKVIQIAATLLLLRGQEEAMPPALRAQATTTNVSGYSRMPEPFAGAADFTE